ncbi:MAG: tetrathionate reductase family octaheme c-type cytochrome, partial [Gammaproteobacteria bacterium]|nr:tetrathionate reductase family octaheme c-type cytochrome [Gammaproteobacteria bacterium]
MQKPAAAIPATAAKTSDVKKAKSKSTADHTKFKELQKNFKDGPAVTEACLSCHTEAAKQVHATKHWTWEFINPATKRKLGKKHVINNFCTSTKTNQTFCSACHIGYGWKDDNFDFTKEESVDCLACHDTTKTYKKYPGLSGHPNYKDYEWPPKSGKIKKPTDLKKIAQNVGKTSRDTCGACHFYGGGGDAVKHGDLDSSLKQPMKYLDVHMDADGLNFSCGECHLSDSHKVSGSRYATTSIDTKGAMVRGKAGERNPTTCVACHDNAPHKDYAKLNDHTDKIACQTCHIPEYARGPRETKMTWDWSTAGKLDEKGKSIKTFTSSGMVAYVSKKGDFTYDRYVIPEYKWFNGEVKYTLFGDKVDGTETVKINDYRGEAGDPNALIWPFKVFRGKQPFDAGNQTLAVFHTAGNDENAFWGKGHYNWEKALKAGMAATGVPYSGKMGFVKTEMSWPITHMVAPKEDALSCAQCH